jgi:hypothetical protein
MTDDMIKEHLVRAHLAESVTLDAGTWTEVLEEVLRLRGVSYDLLGELSAFRAAQHLRQASEDLRSRTTGLQIGNFTLSRYDDISYWLAHKDGEGMQVSQGKLQTAMYLLWQDF